MSSQAACFICCAPRAALLCPECHVARYCSEACQHMALVERHHAITLCPQLREFHHNGPTTTITTPSTRGDDSISTLKERLMRNKNASLGMYIEYRGALLSTVNDKPVYEWFRNIMLNEIKANTTLPAIYLFDRINNPSNVANVWFEQHRFDLRKYLQFLTMANVTFDHQPSVAEIERLGMEDALAQTMVVLLVDDLIEFRRNADDEDEEPPIYPSFFEQFWLSYLGEIKSEYYHVRNKEQPDRIKKRMADDMESLQEKVRSAKRQRTHAFTLHHPQIEFNDLPGEMYWNIAFFWPARTVLEFFNLNREFSKLYGARAVDLLIKRDFLEPLGPLSPTIAAYIASFRGDIISKPKNKLTREKQTFLKWLIVSSYGLDMAAHRLEVGNLVSTLHLGNWIASLQHYTGSILQLYYKSVIYTMVQPFYPTLRSKKGTYNYGNTSRLDIIGGSGLHIRGLFNEKEQQHQFELLSTTFTYPPNSQLELAVAKHVFNLNALIEEEGDMSLVDAAYHLLIRFLITNVDPTVEVWYNFRNQYFDTDVMDYQLLIPKDVSFFGTLETRLVAPGCLVSGLRYGARYHFDNHPAYKPGKRSPGNGQHKLHVTRATHYTLGAIFNERWNYSIMQTFIGLDPAYGRSNDDDDDDDDMDDG